MQYNEMKPYAIWLWTSFILIPSKNGGLPRNISNDISLIAASVPFQLCRYALVPKERDL